jgi:DNA-binding response OmpR family regulator
MMMHAANTAVQYDVPPQILVMEDDASVAQGLKMILSEEGFGVDLADTGRLALDAFHEKRFDLLVADLRLPDVSGMEIIKQVRAETPETEVIVITGYGTTATAVEAMKLGVHDFLPKPFTEEQIKSAIDEALQDQRRERGVATVKAATTPEEKIIQTREVCQVLNRTADDRAFWKDLMEHPSEALANYDLSSEAKAAIASGDLKWINRNVGELTQKQLMFVYSRLEREAW